MLHIILWGWPHEVVCPAGTMFNKCGQFGISTIIIICRKNQDWQYKHFWGLTCFILYYEDDHSEEHDDIHWWGRYSSDQNWQKLSALSRSIRTDKYNPHWRDQSVVTSIIHIDINNLYWSIPFSTGTTVQLYQYYLRISTAIIRVTDWCVDSCCHVTVKTISGWIKVCQKLRHIQ